MATVSTWTERGNDGTITLKKAGIAIADTFEATDLEANSHLTHCFLGVSFFKADGTTVSDPTSGTFAVKVRTKQNPGVWEDPATATITAATPVTIDFAGNIVGIQLIPSGPIAGDSVNNYTVIMTRNAT